MCKKSFDNEVDSIFNNRILDSINKPGDVVSLNLSIKASHSGKINSNNIFYTPRSMEEGATTLVKPFSKHLQKLHRGNAVGIINSSEYVDYSDNYTDKIKEISERINSADTSEQLVAAVKELINTEEYKSKDYLGLGVIKVNADLHDKSLIKELTTGKNKGKVSIGGDSYSVFCSICGGMYDDNHIHQRGMSYNGERCFAIYDNMLLDHIGFVPDPADDDTETSIIRDSIIDRSNSVTINSYKIEDNKQGKSMTLTVEKLKELSKTSESLLGLDAYKDVDAKVLEALKTKFDSELQNGRKSSYLFSEEKTLPLKSKETVALAKLAIDSLDDSDVEKKALQTLVQNQLDKHFKDGETVDKFLEEYKVPEVTKETVKAEPATEGQKQFAELSEQSLEALSNSVAEKILETMKPASQPVEDSVGFKQLASNNKQLTDEIEELIEANKVLTEESKNLLVGRIASIQGLEEDEEYLTKLKGRDIASLKDSLSDLEYTVKKKQTSKTETDLEKQKPTKEDETKKEPKPAEHTKEEPKSTENKQEGSEESKKLSKKTISDSLQKEQQKDEGGEKQLSASDYIKTYGYSAYIKSKKG